MTEERDRTAEYECGTIVGNRYRVLRTIAHGGMSTVYLVRDEKLGREWAMKTVGKEADDNGRLCRQSLMAEISILRKLRSPGLPGIIDVIDGETSLCLVMDYIEGETLLEIVRREGPQDEKRAVEWIRRLTEVIGELHRQHPPIIYRDMKPGNVMLCPDGRLVLFDFGIAREYKTLGTADTTCLGTVGYAAPEQFGGHGQTDGRTDIYGLGATLYYLVTGRDPAQPPYEMLPVREVRPELSAGLELLILKCTKRDPEERYRDCSELLDALGNYQILDVLHQRREKRKLLVFCSSLVMGSLCLLAGTVFHGAAVREKKNNYAAVLAEAGKMGAESLRTGSYDQAVTDAYLGAAELFPGEEEPYLRLLDYCCDAGETTAALAVICARIDSGLLGERNSGELIYRVADLYFSGNEGDALFRKDYRKAERYFAMLDSGEYPEAAEYAGLSAALGVFGREVEWENVAACLQSASARCRGMPPGTRRIRNMLLIAEVCLTNRYELEYIGENPVPHARELFRGALDDAENLAKEGRDTLELRIRALKGLAVSCSLRKETAEEAYGWFERLLELADEQDVKEIRMEEITAMMTAEEDVMVKELFDMMIEDYPDDRDVYIRYCTWLLETGDAEYAREIWQKGCDSLSPEGDSGFGDLERRVVRRA